MLVLTLSAIPAYGSLFWFPHFKNGTFHGPAGLIIGKVEKSGGGDEGAITANFH